MKSPSASPAWPTGLLNQLRAGETGYLKVKVVPKSPKTEIAEVLEDETVKIRVAAPPENGKANAELRKFLKKQLKLESAEILSGAADRVKLLRLRP